jgi:hypothetical protein
MKRSPEWLLLMAPFAVAAGFALHQALSKGSTLAWCAFTAFFVFSLGILGLAGLYVWYCRQAERDSRAGAYFQDWPRELDILLSHACSSERRALAAAQLAAKAILKNWPYRADAIQSLEYVASLAGTPPEVKASAIGSLASFDLKSCPPAIAELASDPAVQPYVRCAAVSLIAQNLTMRKQLLAIILSRGLTTTHILWCVISVLCRVVSGARSKEEREELAGLKAELLATEGLPDWAKSTLARVT